MFVRNRLSMHQESVYNYMVAYTYTLTMILERNTECYNYQPVVVKQPFEIDNDKNHSRRRKLQGVYPLWY